VFLRQTTEFNNAALIFIAEAAFFLPLIYMAAKFLIPFGLIKKNTAKLSPYECGFNPFSLRRTQLDIKFFLLALLFLVFDIEILIIVPFTISLFSVSFIELCITLIFLLYILISIVWEINSGTLRFT